MTATASFDGTLEQRHAALTRANEIRIGRAHLKRNLADGTITLETALWDDYAQGMRIRELIEQLPRFGPVRATKLVDELRIGRDQLVSALSDSRLEQLVTRIAARGKTK